MKFADPLPDEIHANIALYGAEKTGKSTLACSAPAKVLHVNCNTADATRFARRKFGDNVLPVECEGFETLKEVARDAKSPKRMATTYVIDEMGSLYTILLEEFSKRAISPSLPTYGRVNTEILRFVREMCRIPDINAIFVFHEIPIKDEATGEFERLPFSGTGNPQLGKDILSLVTIISYCGYVDEDADSPYAGKYIAQLKPTKGRRGGSRLQGLAKIEPPPITAWFEKMKRAEDELKAQQRKG